MSSRELDDLLDQLDEMPESASKIPLTEEAIRLADQFNMESDAFDLRLDLIKLAVFYGQPLKALPAFSWCLAVAEREDSDFDVDYILWEYKWICSNLPHFYEFSLDKISEMLEDFKLRLRGEGYNLSSYWYQVMHFGIDTKNKELAREGYENMKKYPKDRMADCRACIQDGLVNYAIFMDDYKLALELAKNILEGRMKCAEVPHYTFSKLILPSYRAGDFEMAADMEARGYRLISQNSEYLGSMGDYLRYYSLVDTGKGLERYRKHVHWSFDQFTSHDKRFDFSWGAASLFASILKEGQEEIKMVLPSQHPLFNNDGAYSVKALLDYHKGIAEDIGGKFDKRNGNNSYTENLTRVL